MSYSFGISKGRYDKQVEINRLTDVSNPPTHASVTPDPSETYKLINNVRVAHGLNPLRFNEMMCEFSNIRLSQVHSDWSHNGYLNAKRYFHFVHFGENLVQGYGSASSAVEAWIKSPEHYENIVNPNYTDTCIVSDFYGGLPYAVQHFASF